MTMSTTRPGSGEVAELAPYLRAARRFPPLTRDEEYALALRAREGDGSARQQLVQHSLAFVVLFALKQRRGAVRLDDLVQEGNLGLMRAAELFDPHAGNRFLTYATWWIRAYIGRYLKQARSTVRPRSGTVAQADFSLDTPLGEDGDEDWLERLEDECPGPEDACSSAEADRQIRGALDVARARIGELGWEIVRDRLQSDSPTTLQEIGDRWDISRERVRQVELKTKRVLRRRLEPLLALATRDAA
ncbi:MAG TPA: sigma-70 family RNA polymerase sigma factor [Anaeromyxobacteraceae bacterium]|nr:sigma-70 family RNA polymerase sigma factor [Anaeromyxobacteraceae bacterium]